MGNRITVDAEEWEKIRNDVKELKQSRKTQRIENEKQVVSKDILTPNERTVFAYIEQKVHSNKQELVDHFKGNISRDTIFDIVKNLVKYGMINDNPDPANRQYRTLTVNNDSILYATIKELDDFHDSFVIFCERVLARADKVTHNSAEWYSLMAVPYEVFLVVLQMYALRVMIWPSVIQDEVILKKLILIVFDRLVGYRVHLPSIKIEGSTDNYIFEILMVRLLNGTEFLKHFHTYAKKLKVEKEGGDVLEAIWGINRSIQIRAYPEPRIFDWDFKYGKDSWKKLLTLCEKHPNENIKNKDMIKKVQDAILDRKLKW